MIGGVDTIPDQRDRVKAILRANRPRPFGVCAWSIYKGDEYGPLPNGRNCVSELIRWEGWKIRADVGKHTCGPGNRPVHAHYFVEFDADRETQLPFPTV